MVSNNDLISTQKAADILAVSASTVRRWAEDGTLQCFRVGNSKYRKFEYSKVIELKEKFYGKESVSESVETEPKIIKQSIEASAHPAHYLMHKYWGRKPHNVVGEYISNYTNEGDVVLEPFMGSGVTVIEAIKQKRKAIGIDINPMSEFIVKNTISNVDLEKFTCEYSRIISQIKEKFSGIYDTKCPHCQKIGEIETAVWENDQLVRVKMKCKEHGIVIKDADDFDIRKYESCVELKDKLKKKKEIVYPTNSIMKYVKRSGRERIDELFSDRALILLGSIKKEIDDVDDSEIRNLLLFCFTSMLSNVSRMLPGDKAKSTYKSGWVISKFWTPQIHTERNVFMCMELRYKAILKGKKEIIGIDSTLANIKVGDSSKLSEIKDNSIDYIFTDPPYGESIAYLALSQFWNSWLFPDVKYEDEIIIDPYRNKGYDDYSNRTSLVYKELYRVLKPNHYMSFTFHNRDLFVWKAILDACKQAGFVLEHVVLQEQAVSSGTQGINKNNTLTGDFVYSFKKITDRHESAIVMSDAKSFVAKEIDEFIKRNNGATPSELYEYIVPIIVANNAYTDDEGHAINIETILRSKYSYVEVENNNRLGGAYKWVQKN